MESIFLRPPKKQKFVREIVSEGRETLFGSPRSAFKSFLHEAMPHVKSFS